MDGAEPDEFRDDAERALLLAESAAEPILLTIAYQATLRLAHSTGDLPRVDALLEPHAVASERGHLPFGTVRRHLCEVTNALARGQLDDVRELIATTPEVGHHHRARTLLERGVRLSQESTGWLWAAHARLWLAEVLLESRAPGDVAEAIAEIDAVAASSCFSERWRVGRHAALLRSAIAEDVTPGDLRNRQRRVENAS